MSGTSTPAREKKRRFPRTVQITLILWLIVEIGLRIWPEMDHALANLASVAATVLMLLVLETWLLVASRFSWQRRRAEG